jgi:hypothetical protein
MQRSQPGLPARLARVNPTSAFLVALVVVLVGLFLPGVIGALVLLVLAAGLATLLARTWPVQSPPTRAIRLVMLALLVAVALFKIL